MTDSAPADADGYHLDSPRLDAALKLFGRVGAAEFQVGHLEDDTPIAKARWWAHVKYAGIRIQVDEHPGPVEAAEALALRLLHGSRCQGCDKLVAAHDGDVPIPQTLVDGSPVDPAHAAKMGICRWTRQDTDWVRGCGPVAPEGSTRERLARAMAEAGVPAVGIAQARAGYYDEWLGQLPFPIMTLVADLEKNGFHQLAARARNGEFDGTADESHAWANSPEGRATFGEFAASIAAGANRAKKGGKTPPATRTDGRPAWRANGRKKKPKKR